MYNHDMKLFFLKILFVFLIPISVFAQVSDDLLREVLQDELKGSSQQEEEKGYESFTQNQLKNTVSQLRKVDDELERNLFLSKLQEDRLELASKLCSKDQRACFLIDEYKKYKELSSPSDVSELKIFGIDIFSGYPMSFDAIDESSLGSDYKLKVGDKLRIFITGMNNLDSEIIVRNNGELLIPGFGPVNVTGLTISDAIAKTRKFIQLKDVGSEVFLSLNQVKTNQVYVFGMVNNPGAYFLNALGTSINGIISSGGFLNSASLRNIKIVRDGVSIQNIDLYDLLISGDSSNDISLESGDVILVNSMQNRVTISGEVIRPAIYEFLDGESVADVISFSLGMTPFANLDSISIKRRLDNGNFEILTAKTDSDLKIKNGDQIIVHSNQGTLASNIIIEGAIKSEGRFKYQDGAKLGQIINIESDFLDTTYLPYALIKRFNKLSKGWQFINFHLFDQNTLDNIDLFDRDEIYIFSKDDIAVLNSSLLKGYLNPSQKNNTKDNNDIEMEYYSSKSSDTECLEYFDSQKNSVIVDAIINKLEIFSSSREGACTDFLNQFSELTPLLFTSSIPLLGNLRNPGLYPISPGVSDDEIVGHIGGLLLVSPNMTIESGRDNTFVEPLLTYVNVKIDDSVDNQGFINLVGEFVNPGIYPFNKGDTILDIYNRAGGLTSSAYPLAGVMSRLSVRKKEIDALKIAEREISEILSNAAASGYLKQSSTDLVALVELMANISNSNPIGRVITELNYDLLRKNPRLDLPLESGDTIYIPSMMNTVNVAGQVLNPVTIPYDNSLTNSEYISRAGGVKSSGDIKRAYIIQPNGETIQLSSGLFSSVGIGNKSIMPGATIIVPRKPRPLDSLALVETVSPILASLSVTAASIAAISNNN